MFSWASIILVGLEIIKAVQDWAIRKKYIDEGQAIAIAKSQAEILRESQYAKQALEEFTGDSESTVDDFLRQLGRDGGDIKR